MFIVFAQSAIGADFKITSANYDLSNSVVVLSAKDTTDEVITENIVLKKLDNPTRYYFDINSAILGTAKQDWVFQTGNFDRILISQFNINPNVVRVVVYPKNDVVISSVKFYRLKNNIIMRFNGNDIQNDYFQHVYRDEHSSAGDFYENLKVVYPSAEQSSATTFKITNVGDTQEIITQQPKDDFKKFRLNTKYYLNSVRAVPDSVLLSGFGEMTFEKPMILQNPTRLIYDFPNAVSAGELRNKSFPINLTDKIVIGQFSINKVRAVIYTENPFDYTPVLSSDNQSILFINQRIYNTAKLNTTPARITNYDIKENNSLTQTMSFSFDSPVVHSVNRDNNALSLTFYNVPNFSEESFRMRFASSFFANAKIIKTQTGVRVYLPLRTDSQVNTYLGADGKVVKIVLKETEKSKSLIYNIPLEPTTKPAIIKPTPNSKRVVIIDAGHGGTDCGAIRNGINEKDIVLDIALKVEKELAKRGHKVVMTRNNDTFISLQERVDISAQERGDIFVSIHVNSSVKPEIEGVETHYYRQESLGLAQAVHESLISNLKPYDRGLFKSKFYVINHTEMPAILCEIGFISNEQEQQLLVTEKRKQDTAKAIVEGVLKYFEQER